jgi:hypothetical protein
MANILKFSKRPGDLLHEEGSNPKDMPVCPSNNLLAAKKLNDAPDANFVAVPHELLSSTDRRITLEGVVNERRNVGGTAQAEQLIR